MLDLDQIFAPVPTALQRFALLQNYSAKIKCAVGYAAH
jgi:hypothetical protein